MRIAVASGKGGTGKTSIAVSLAIAAAQNTSPVAYVDCDVEEPNGHLLLHPDDQKMERVTVPVPQIDEKACTNCGQCASICAFGAIARLGDRAVAFPELCHSCGGCMRVCPESAITEIPREIGRIEKGTTRYALDFIGGRMNIGEALSPPIIHAVLRDSAHHKGTLIIDAPPGTSCPAVSALRGSDFCILVTEPTLFGLHDLSLVLDVVKQLDILCGVVINKAGPDNSAAYDLCASRGIEVLAEIPDDTGIAQAYSRGIPAVVARPALMENYSHLWKTITAKVGMR